MARFLVVFVLIFSLQYYGQATRFLPMIVWDHINPMLKCKCNWLTNIPKIDEYDRVDFMCPSLKVAVKLLDGYSRPKSEMNENIFRRKWEGNKTDLTELGKALHDGSFCNISKSRKLHSCKNGEEGKSLGVTFKETNGYKTGDIFVFFNNGDDGKAKTLSSQAVKCSMVLVINITWSAKVKHDISYGKHLNPDGDMCDCTNIAKPLDCQCKKDNQPPSTTRSPSSKPPTTTSKLSTTQQTTATPTPTNNSTGNPAAKSTPTTNPTDTFITTTNSTDETTNKPNTGARGNSSDEKWSLEMFFIGFVAGMGLLGVVVFICFMWLRGKPQQPKGCMCMQTAVFTVQNSTSSGPGYPNAAYQSSTLPREGIGQTVAFVTPLDCPDGQSPGNPKEGFQPSAPPKAEIKETIELYSPADCPDGQIRQEKTG